MYLLDRSLIDNSTLLLNKLNLYKYNFIIIIWGTCSMTICGIFHYQALHIIFVIIQKKLTMTVHINHFAVMVWYQIPNTRHALSPHPLTCIQKSILCYWKFIPRYLAIVISVWFSIECFCIFFNIPSFHLVCNPRFQFWEIHITIFIKVYMWNEDPLNKKQLK